MPPCGCVPGEAARVFATFPTVGKAESPGIGETIRVTLSPVFA